MKLVNNLSYLLIELVSSCNYYANKNINTNTNKLHNPITLIFVNKPIVENTYKFQNGLIYQTFEPGTVYFDNLSDPSGVTLSPKKNDTITLYPKNDFIVLKQRIDACNYTEYVLERGDSVIFSYRERFPLVINKKSYAKNYVLGLEQIYKNIFNSKKLTPWNMYFNADMFVNWLKPNVQEQVKMRQKDSYKSAIIFFNKEKSLLDSLSTTGKISDSNYSFYVKRNKYLRLLIELKEGNLLMPDVLEYTQEPSDKYSYLSAVYRSHVIEAAIDKFIVHKASYLDLKDGINRDYRQSYTLIQNNENLSIRDKNWLLTREINRIGQTFSRKDFLTFFKKYEQDVKDTTLVNSVRANYKLDFDDGRIATGSVILTNLKGTKITFDDVLKRHKGQIVYVDFWASWCGPCREALPSSTKLRTELKGKNVVFIYLSIDKTIKPWQVASAQENLDTHPENYLVVNYQASDFMKQQKLTSIPRYMIFDKKGKLVYANAPRVESKNLSALLTGLAK